MRLSGWRLQVLCSWGPFNLCWHGTSVSPLPNGRRSLTAKLLAPHYDEAVRLKRQIHLTAMGSSIILN